MTALEKLIIFMNNIIKFLRDFSSTTPKDVELTTYNDDGTTSTTLVPNVKKFQDNLIGIDYNTLSNKPLINQKITIGGSLDVYYPIVLGTGYTACHLIVSRDSIHWDSNGQGRLYYESKFFTTHWGHGADFYIDILNLYKERKFIARRCVEYKSGSVILWLRGASSYRFSGFGYSISDISIEDKEVRGSIYSSFPAISENEELATINRYLS